jgi:oligosaccharide repeat unit polymerase
VYISSFNVILGFYLGYFFARIIKVKIKISGIQYSSVELNRVAYILGATSFCSFAILFILQGEIPLLSSNIGLARSRLLSDHPILWSFTQLSLIFSCVFYYLKSINMAEKKMFYLYVLIFAAILLSGWRAYLLLYAFHFYAPIIFRRKISISKAVLPILLVICIFFVIGFIRGDTAGEFSIDAALSIFTLYIYPAFLNFQELTTYQYDKPTLFTLQFLLKPVLDFLNFETTPMQSTIEAFNVSTAMNPLYSDGGLLNIFIAIFFVSFFLKRLESVKETNILGIFWRTTLAYTIIVLHNGWYLLNFSPTYISVIFIFFIILLKLATKKKYPFV